MKAKKRALVMVLSFVIVGFLAAAGIMLYAELTMDRSGWLQQGDQYYYLDEKGHPITGWHEEDGSRYYFGPDTTMATGWQEIDGQVYYFSRAGIMRTGWVEDGGRWYLDGNGHPVSGWVDVDGVRRYFLPGGMLASGWQEIDGNSVYLSSDGTLTTGWITLADGTYYLTASGTPVKGLTELDGKVYYFFETSGMLLQGGWLDIDENRYYFSETDGSMITGWHTIEGKKFCFSEQGVMLRGWVQNGEYRLYLQEDGSAAVSPTVIDDKIQYFTPEGYNLLLVNYRNPVPDNYQVNLVRYGEWTRVAAEIEQPLRRMILDCRATGIDCWLNCGFRTFDEQTKILEERTETYMSYGMDYASARVTALDTVAVPGYSEHQTGYAVDVVCSVDPVWLQEHCWEYGFILRYPEGKSDITKISYEHWHFRYVGVEVAKVIMESGLCLEEYLGAA